MAKKKKHDIRELLAMLPEAGVYAPGRGLFLMLPSGSRLQPKVYTDRLALA